MKKKMKQINILIVYIVNIVYIALLEIMTRFNTYLFINNKLRHLDKVYPFT